MSTYSKCLHHDCCDDCPHSSPLHRIASRPIECPPSRHNYCHNPHHYTTWTVSGSIDRFELEYRYTVNRCLGTGGPLTVNISDVSVRSYTLRDLNEDSSYTITVRAINTAGSTMAMTTGSTSTAGKSFLKGSCQFETVDSC